IDFFVQAEDGIRDRNVTGVQTCALPLSFSLSRFDCCKAFFRASSTSSNNSSSSNSSYKSSSMISECVCLSFFISHPTSCLLIVFPLVPSQNFYLGQLMHLVYHKKSSTHYITFHRLKNNGNLES